MGDSLADQLRKAGFEASGRPPSEDAPAPEEDSAATEAPDFASKVVVRYSRKGRKGKTVTLVAGVRAGREVLLARMKRELGVGGRLEGEEVVLQGNQVERVSRWLESQGAKRVVR